MVEILFERSLRYNHTADIVPYMKPIGTMLLQACQLCSRWGGGERAQTRDINCPEDFRARSPVTEPPQPLLS
ncbi:hypothetical protein PoB_001149500 [Plakobranchus ocellatus]|uniref:Uncharacterized protein n=1 Tax=Plakobranchus ocellatus TaxID=259542 RepID=A0AAV3YQI3_9GAST|nr:hypothetical protein PoB_001149500 [Plakobranchus ocellatus]